MVAAAAGVVSNRCGMVFPDSDTMACAIVPAKKKHMQSTETACIHKQPNSRNNSL